MTDFEAVLAGFAALDEEALARPWSWRDQQMDVREALYRTLEDAQEAHVLATAGAHAESRRILALAQRAFGDLRGLLVGLPIDLLDEAPRAGDWPVRETLRHMLFVERRYAMQTLYAVERTDGEPVRIPEERLPPAAQIDASGDVERAPRPGRGGASGDEPPARCGGSRSDDPADDMGAVRGGRPLSSSPARRARGRAHDPVREDPRGARLAAGRGPADRASAFGPGRRARGARRARGSARDRKARGGALRVGHGGSAPRLRESPPAASASRGC